jgi:hypothetical protein
MPAEVSKKFGPVDIDYEIGYLAVHKGSDGWITGLLVGHEFTPKLELDGEFYYQGTFHPSFSQPSFDFGGRYKLHSPLIFLFMAGRLGAERPEADLFPRLFRDSTASASQVLQVTSSFLSSRQLWPSAPALRYE